VNARLEALARDKQALLMRSALCRLRLRRETYLLRDSLRWKNALSLAGFGRATRLVLFASRAAFALRLARAAIAHVRHRTDTRKTVV